MPIYEYRCQECGKVFSLLFLRSADANGQERCSACGSGQTKRLISTFAIGGRVDPGPGRTAWPTNWKDTNGADPETLRYWRHRIEREARLEEKYPELADPSLLAGKSEIPVWGADAPTPQEAPSHAVEHSHGEHHHLSDRHTRDEAAEGTSMELAGCFTNENSQTPPTRAASLSAPLSVRSSQ